MICTAKTTGRWGKKCNCCMLWKPANKRGRDTERRMLKRRERQTWKREIV